MTDVVVHISGMDCGTCARLTYDEAVTDLGAIARCVQRAGFDVPVETAELRCPGADAGAEARLRVVFGVRSVARAGDSFTVTLWPVGTDAGALPAVLGPGAELTAQRGGEEAVQGRSRQWLARRLGLAALLTVLLLWRLPAYVQLALAAAVLFGTGAVLWRGTWRALCGGSLEPDAPGLLAAAVLFVYGTYAVFLEVQSCFFASCGIVCALLHTRGVISAQAHYWRSRVTITYDPDIVMEDALRQVLTSAGYPPSTHGMGGVAAGAVCGALGAVITYTPNIKSMVFTVAGALVLLIGLRMAGILPGAPGRERAARCLQPECTHAPPLCGQAASHWPAHGRHAVRCPQRHVALCHEQRQRGAWRARDAGIVDARQGHSPFWYVSKTAQDTVLCGFCMCGFNPASGRPRGSSRDGGTAGRWPSRSRPGARSRPARARSSP